MKSAHSLKTKRGKITRYPITGDVGRRPPRRIERSAPTKKGSRRRPIETPTIITPKPVLESTSEPTPQSIPTAFDPPPISRSIPKLNLTIKTKKRILFDKIVGVIKKAIIILFIFGLIGILLTYWGIK